MSVSARPVNPRVLPGAAVWPVSRCRETIFSEGKVGTTESNVELPLFSSFRAPYCINSSNKD